MRQIKPHVETVGPVVRVRQQDWHADLVVDRPGDLEQRRAWLDLERLGHRGIGEMRRNKLLGRMGAVAGFGQ